MMKYKLRKIFDKHIEASLDVLKRIELLTIDKKRFLNFKDFKSMTKDEYIKYILKELEND